MRGTVSHSPWNLWGLVERFCLRVLRKDKKQWKLRQTIVKNLLADGFDVQLHPNPYRINATRDGSEFDMDVWEDGNFSISALLRDPDKPGSSYFNQNPIWKYLIEDSVRRAKFKCGIRGCWVQKHEQKSDGRWGPNRCANCGTTEVPWRENMDNQDDELALCSEDKHKWYGNQRLNGRWDWLVRVCENGAWPSSHKEPNGLIEGTVACTVLGLMRDYKRMEMFLEDLPCTENHGRKPVPSCKRCGGSGKAIDVFKRSQERE